MQICICKNKAHFRLGNITVNAAKTSPLLYLYALKYCSSGDNQMRFSSFVAVTWWVSRYNHTRNHIQLYNPDKLWLIKIILTLNQNFLKTNGMVRVFTT